MLKIISHNETVTEKFEVFHMQYIRKILEIKWNNGVDDKIVNVKVRNHFNNFEVLTPKLLEDVSFSLKN